ncbi:hypothetical protein SDC9_183271 [bioreactor metagenome]|uniref:XdhC- CoxI domain-containing protein n=1 Tax=bioreactor metagenome TaxID=1076179 RepID=A0A645HBN1_9ZZZZ
MIIWPHGRILGSIGGGCGESDVVRAAMDVMDSGLGRIVEVDMTGETAENGGMVCGGAMRIAVEPLPE